MVDHRDRVSPDFNPSRLQPRFVCTRQGQDDDLATMKTYLLNAAQVDSP